MSLDFVEAIPSKDILTQSCCPFHRERLAEGCRPESEKVQALPTRSTTQLRIQSPVSSDTPPLLILKLLYVILLCFAIDMCLAVIYTMLFVFMVSSRY